MSIQIFRRLEQKYILDSNSYNELMNRIKDKIEKDHYYKSNILNIYFDSNKFDLIIDSLEKPPFKKKVRLRSYSTPNMCDKVFLEIKNKYNGVVGKRRVEMTLKEFYDYYNLGIIPNVNKQIMSEIDYFFKKYSLIPKIFVGYDRLSFYDKNDINFRITFDKDVRYRFNNLKLEFGDSGKNYFSKDNIIMEIKSLNSIPIWFTNILTELNIYPISFSKIGNIYKDNYNMEELYV